MLRRRRERELFSLNARQRAAMARSPQAPAQTTGAGEAPLASPFGGYAMRERKAANRLRALSVVVLLAIAVIGAIVLLQSTSKNSAIPIAFLKLLLAAPLAVLATYLARESSSHRDDARWAAEVELQLLTVDRYTAPLTAGLRNELRAELGHRVFSAHEHRPRAEIDTTTVSGAPQDSSSSSRRSARAKSDPAPLFAKSQ